MNNDLNNMEGSSLISRPEQTDSDDTPANYTYSAIFGEEESSKYSRQTILGDVRNPKRFTWVEWVFLVLSSVAFLGTLAITVERFVSFHSNFNLTSDNETFLLQDCDEWTCTSDFTYTVLLIANILFCLFYAIDGVLRERGFEILAIPVAIVIVVVYIIGNYIYKMNELEDPFRITRLVLACLFGPPLAILAVWIYIRNGRLQFNIVGSNRTLMRVYRVRSFIITLLAFNLHLLCNFVILVMTRQLTFIDKTERFIIVLFLLYILLITPIGWIGLNYEITWLTIVFSIFFLPSITYYVYKIVDVGMDIKKYWNPEGNYNDNPEPFKFIAITLFIVSIIGVLVHVLVLVFLFLAMKDFKKGLNEKMVPPFKECFRFTDRKRNVNATFIPST